MVFSGKPLGSCATSLVSCTHCTPVYDSGSVFSPSLLDITDDDLLKTFMQVNRSSLIPSRNS